MKEQKKKKENKQQKQQRETGREKFVRDFRVFVSRVGLKDARGNFSFVAF